MSSHLFITSAFAAGIALSADQLELADTIGFLDNKDIIAAVPPDGDALLDGDTIIVDAETADMFEIAEERKGTRLKTRRSTDKKIGTNRQLNTKPLARDTNRLRSGDNKLEPGKLQRGNDIIQGRDRCCTVEAN